MLHKKAQFINEVIKYLLVGLFTIVILAAGYKIIANTSDKSCDLKLAEFEIKFRDIERDVRYGAKESKSYILPCNADEVFFFDLDKDIDATKLNKTPLIKDSIAANGQSNVFLYGKGKLIKSFYTGNLELTPPYYICLRPQGGKIEILIESFGKSVGIEEADSKFNCNLQ